MSRNRPEISVPARRAFTFGIVGGGLTATSMLCQLVEKARARAVAGNIDPRRIEAAVFEKTDDFGPGFPHNECNLLPLHITNMCAADMGVYADRPGDFQVWVDRNMDRLRNRFPGFAAEYFAPPPGPCRHYPRAFMGEYLRARFQEAVDAARRCGLTVRPFPCHEVVDIHLDDDVVRIAAEHSQGHLEMPFDAVLLATGHWFTESGRQDYFDSPWPADRLLERVPPGASVAVIGTSLSAIETALTLTSDGRFRKAADGRLVYAAPGNPRTVTLYSRRGLLPKVRGKLGSHRNRFLTLEAFEKLRRDSGGRISLNAVFGLLNAELERVYGRTVDWSELLEPSGSAADFLRRCLSEAVTGDGPKGEVLWQTVLYQSFAFVREWYLTLTGEERSRFDRAYTSVFFTHAATQPRVNAAKLLALLEAGRVRVVKLGRNYRFYHDNRSACYRFDYTDGQGRPRSDSYRYVVNARGQSRFLDTDPSRLASRLIAKGWVRMKPAELPAHGSRAGEYGGDDPAVRAGGIRINPATHQVITPRTEHSGAGVVYAVGAMTRERIIDASMAHGLSRSTAAIADCILDGLAPATRDRKV